MRFGTWSSAALALIAVLATTIRIAAQDGATSNNAKHHHYQAIDIGTFGGPNSSFAGNPPEVRLLNNSGAAVGGGDTPTPDPSCIGFNFDCYLAYGFKWQDGVAHELGALPGFNSSMTVWVSDSGLVVGLSQNGIDPLTGAPAFEAILWGQDGSITDLGTLGGNQSIANAVNNRGQVAGVALNTIPDAYTSTGAFYVAGATQAHAFRWTKSQGMQDLGTLGGTDSIAVLTNERGQIAGWSFTNTAVNLTTGFPTLDPFLWENGTMLDLGTLGGTFGQANGLNNRGQVVGYSNVAGDSTLHAFLWRNKPEGMQDLGTLGGDNSVASFINDAGEIVGYALTADEQYHAFLWRHGMMTDLGTLGTDPGSAALGINSQGQVVGNTFIPGTDLRGFLWELSGPMVDLNTLIPSNPDLELTRALYINDRGEIAAQGNFSNGDIHAFVLIPCDEMHPDVSGCDYGLADASTLAPNATPRFLPKATQHPHQPWRMNRFHIPGRAVLGEAAGIATQVSPVPEFTPPPPVLYVSATPLTPSSVNPGGSSTSTVTVYFGTNPVTTAALSCSVQPSPPLGATCSINPTSAAPATLTVSTFGPSGRLLSRPGSGLLYAVWLPLIGLVATGVGLGSNQNGQKGKPKTVALACVLLLGLTFQTACGGSHSSGTPAGKYTITVTATAFVPVNTTFTTTMLTVQ